MRTRPLGKTWSRKRRRNSSRSKCHELLLAAMSVVLPAKGDAIVVESDETMVGDGNAVSVTSQIVEDVFWPTERRLSIDDPVVMEELM